jgi:hypothetical protein
VEVEVEVEVERWRGGEVDHSIQYIDRPTYYRFLERC